MTEDMTKTWNGMKNILLLLKALFYFILVAHK